MCCFRAGLLALCLGAVFAWAVPVWSACGDGVLDLDEGCDDHNRFGGDGCAQNCTRETVRPFIIDPARSPVSTQLDTLVFTLNLTGSVKFTTGGPSADGNIPFVIQDENVHFDPIQVPPIGCVCVDSQAVPGVFGPGNVAAGSIGCGGDDFFLRDYVLTQDHNVGMTGTCVSGDEEGMHCTADPNCEPGCRFTEADCHIIGGRVEPPNGNHPGVCNGESEMTVTGGGRRGSAAFLDNVAFVFFFDGGSCCVAGVDPGCEDPEGLKGPDGIPCTADDLLSTTGMNLPGTTGTANAVLVDFNNEPGKVLDGDTMCGEEPCIAAVSGEPFDCDAIMADPNGGLDTGVFALAFPILDNADFGDSLATIRLAATSTSVCGGDCNENGQVTVNELVTAVNIALGTSPVADCPAADGDSSGSVEINELVTAVNHALSGCK
jgi:cysteine-rich repeat protein